MCADLEDNWVRGAIRHSKLLVQAESGTEVGSVPGSPSYYGLISIQMPAIQHSILGLHTFQHALLVASKLCAWHHPDSLQYSN